MNVAQRPSTSIALAGLLSVSLALGPAASASAAARMAAAPALAEATAEPVDWSTTFEPAAVGSYLGEGRPKVMVVGANAVSKDAASSLRSALKTSGRAALVIDDSAIGAVDGLDDAAIVERAKGQPVDRIAIVRVFEGGVDEAPDVVVTMYEPEGKVAAALTGTAGIPVAAREGGGASVGVNEQAAEAVSELAGEGEAELEKDEAALEQAEREYEAKYLWFEEWIGVSAQTGTVMARWSQMKQGKYGTDVKGAGLYKIVGRDDLVRKYRTRQGTRLGLGLTSIVGGVALMNVGLAFALLNATAEPPDFGWDDPLGQGTTEAPTRVSNAGAWAMAGVGVGLLTFGIVFISVFKAHPVSKAEAGALMDDYNRDLRKKLGLPKRRATLRLAPTVGVNNGAVVSGRF